MNWFSPQKRWSAFIWKWVGYRKCCKYLCLWRFQQINIETGVKDHFTVFCCKLRSEREGNRRDLEYLEEQRGLNHNWAAAGPVEHGRGHFRASWTLTHKVRSRLKLPHLMLSINLFTLSLCDVELSVDPVEEGSTSCCISSFSHISSSHWAYVHLKPPADHDLL